MATKRSSYLRQLTEITDQLSTAQRVAQVLPQILGAEGPRRYFMGFLVNAEARGTGGLLGSYAILDVKDGKLSFSRFGDHNELKDALITPELAAALPTATPTGGWTATTASAHFPTVGKTWLDLWKMQFGETLDGAIATDPIGLSYLLRATGPVKANNGEDITADNVVEKLESTAYLRYGDGDQAPRKDYLLDIAEKAAGVIVGAGDPKALLDAVQAAARDNRVRVYLARPPEQAVVAGTELSGELPAPGRPLAYVVVQNYAQNKMEYYLKREVTYHQGGCEKPAWIEVRFTNTLSPSAVASMPSYVVGVTTPNPKVTAPRGSSYLYVKVYLGSTPLRRATLNAKPFGMRPFVENGLLAAAANLAVPAGSTEVLRLELADGPAGTPLIPVQPLVQPQVSTIVPAVCSPSASPRS